MKFHPSPQVPALQYVGNVDAGGAAEIAGLRTGDFLIEVRCAAASCWHQELIRAKERPTAPNGTVLSSLAHYNCIRKPGNTLCGLAV